MNSYFNRLKGKLMLCSVKVKTWCFYGNFNLYYDFRSILIVRRFLNYFLSRFENHLVSVRFTLSSNKVLLFILNLLSDPSCFTYFF